MSSQRSCCSARRARGQCDAQHLGDGLEGHRVAELAVAGDELLQTAGDPGAAVRVDHRVLVLDRGLRGEQHALETEQQVDEVGVRAGPYGARSGRCGRPEPRPVRPAAGPWRRTWRSPRTRPAARVRRTARSAAIGRRRCRVPSTALLHIRRSRARTHGNGKIYDTGGPSRDPRRVRIEAVSPGAHTVRYRDHARVSNRTQVVAGGPNPRGAWWGLAPAPFVRL